VASVHYLQSFIPRRPGESRGPATCNIHKDIRPRHSPKRRLPVTPKSNFPRYALVLS